MENKNKSSDKAHSEPLQQCNVVRSFYKVQYEDKNKVTCCRIYEAEDESDAIFKFSFETGFKYNPKNCIKI